MIINNKEVYGIFIYIKNIGYFKIDKEDYAEIEKNLNQLDWRIESLFCDNNKVLLFIKGAKYE